MNRLLTPEERASRDDLHTREEYPLKELTAGRLRILYGYSVDVGRWKLRITSRCKTCGHSSGPDVEGEFSYERELDLLRDFGRVVAEAKELHVYD